ncbi:hypothetical protein F5B19DRAFT_351913 [Rostrohypoxylon terebratum]|nr:hypothetical protein F5B19DRAFT_351913 [Rostrohypoxylon terebratum]
MIVDKSRDFQWTYINVSLWGSIEINTAVMCCCFPTIRPILVWLMSKALKSRKSTQSSQPNYAPKALHIRCTTEFHLKFPETGDSSTPLQSVVMRADK